jgi:hypothetical protein
MQAANLLKVADANPYCQYDDAWLVEDGIGCVWYNPYRHSVVYDVFEEKLFGKDPTVNQGNAMPILRHQIIFDLGRPPW